MIPLLLPPLAAGGGDAPVMGAGGSGGRWLKLGRLFILLLIICLDTKLTTIIMTQLGIEPRPQSRYPRGTSKPVLASQPSVGCPEPSYSLCSRYEDLEFEGMAVMCPTSVFEIFNGTICRGDFACGDDLRGTMRCQTVGTPAERPVQRTASFSQSTLPRRRVGALGAEVMAARSGTDSYVLWSASFSVWSKLELDTQAVDSKGRRTFHFASTGPHRPKQVLFPPVK